MRETRQIQEAVALTIWIDMICISGARMDCEALR